MHGTFGKMHVMDRTGHTTHEWDPAKPVEVAVAKEMFEKLVKEGYSAFEVEQGGEQGKRVKEFNPQAGKLMMVPHLVGG
jgi:hypothetical protein